MWSRAHVPGDARREAGLRQVVPGKTRAGQVQAKLGKVIGVKFKGERFDCGSVEGYVNATNHYAKKLKIL